MICVLNFYVCACIQTGNGCAVMRWAATWCPKPKGWAEVILSLRSLDEMPGTQRYKAMEIKPYKNCSSWKVPIFDFIPLLFWLAYVHEICHSQNFESLKPLMLDIQLTMTSAFQSSNSETSTCSPEHAAGSCTSQCAVGSCSPASAGDSSELAGPTMVSYLQINRILKQAHFQSLQSRGRTQRHTMTWCVPPSAAREPGSSRHIRASHADSLRSALPAHLQLLWNLTVLLICGWRPVPGHVSGGGSSFR